jgi:hypothetical protein
MKSSGLAPTCGGRRPLVRGLHMCAGMEALLTKVVAAVLGLALLFVMVAAGIAAPPDLDQPGRHLDDRVRPESRQGGDEAGLARRALKSLDLSLSAVN